MTIHFIFWVPIRREGRVNPTCQFSMSLSPSNGNAWDNKSQSLDPCSVHSWLFSFNYRRTTWWWISFLFQRHQWLILFRKCVDKCIFLYFISIQVCHVGMMLLGEACAVCATHVSRTRRRHPLDNSNYFEHCFFSQKRKRNALKFPAISGMLVLENGDRQPGNSKIVG